MSKLKIAAVSLTALLILMVGGIAITITTVQEQASAAMKIEGPALLSVQDVEYSIQPLEQNVSEDLKNQIDENTERLMHADDEDMEVVSEEPDYEYYEDYYYEEPDYGYYEEDYSIDWSNYSTYHPTDGLTPEGGINFYDNGTGERVETAYSSNVLYHYRTSEWTVDDEGFYHDSEGRYVVAASDMEQGTVFETSKGEAIVLDCGCSPGVTDFYVNW